MRPFAIAPSFVMLLSLASVCHADEPLPSLAESIAPYVDAQTVAVTHLDLAAFEVVGAVDLLAEFLHLPPKERDRLQALVVPINVFADTLPEGARADVFVVVSISDLANLPVFVVMPRKTNPAAAAIAMEVRRSLSEQFHTEVVMEQVGDALVTASPRTIERLKTAKPVERPEIAAAFTAAGPGALHLLIVPSADARRAIELLYPKLPEALGGGPTSQLTAQRRVAGRGHRAGAGRDPSAAHRASRRRRASRCAGRGRFGRHRAARPTSGTWQRGSQRRRAGPAPRPHGPGQPAFA